ncbi:MAG: ABC transporter ATP-binding protein [Eubacterium sp.]|jgi:ATP-binding cassette subfamily B multidrug efflux pump
MDELQKLSHDCRYRDPQKPQSGRQNRDPQKLQSGRQNRDPQKLSTYFLSEKKNLAAVTVFGIIYNVGMIAGPWFEGRLAQCLADIFGGKSTAADMINLAVLYVIVIGIVQFSRFMKRLFVRYFANNVNKRMKTNLYASLVRTDTAAMKHENSGELLTKAISDVDACVEGMRKFTTEIFDTGVVMVAYIVMLCVYDVRLALIAFIFPPVSYFIAEHMKKRVTVASREAKESAGRLNAAAFDRAKNALTYRTYGVEDAQEVWIEDRLSDYEKKNIVSGVLETAMKPLYRAISLCSVFFIVYFGGRNVMGIGWTAWNIAAFSTFLSCFLKLSKKSSTAAKLFNAVQKARVSWDRIKPFMKDNEPLAAPQKKDVEKIEVSGLSFSYPDGKEILKDVSFSAHRGQIVGVTGKVACGKSTLGKVLLGEESYRGSVKFDGAELRDIDAYEYCGFLGHNAELLSDTIENNVRLGKSGDVMSVMKDVCLDKDLADMPQGIETETGENGALLSGGQQARCGLARVLFHDKPVLILDDPFASVDKNTEESIFKSLRERYKDKVIILISHRLDIFPRLDKVLFLTEGHGVFGTPAELEANCSGYRELLEIQRSAAASASAGASGAGVSPGSAGASGMGGSSGSAGASGTGCGPGSSGASGTDGGSDSAGASGARCGSGSNGASGTDGSSGSAGASGTGVSPGSSGASGTGCGPGSSGASGTGGGSGKNGRLSGGISGLERGCAL